MLCVAKGKCMRSLSLGAGPIQLFSAVVALWLTLLEKKRHCTGGLTVDTVLSGRDLVKM